jgi:hypothetical protein
MSGHLTIPMTDGFSGAESASDLSQGKAEHVRHSDSYAFRVLKQLRGKGDVPCILKTHSPGVYRIDQHKQEPSS